MLPDPLRGLVVGMGQAKHTQVISRGADQLQAHGQSTRIESCRHVHRRHARQRDRGHHLHPAVIGIGLATIHLRRPVRVLVEGKDLGAGQDEEVELCKERQHALKPGAAHRHGLLDLQG